MGRLVPEKMIAVGLTVVGTTVGFFVFLVGEFDTAVGDGDGGIKLVGVTDDDRVGIAVERTVFGDRVGTSFAVLTGCSLGMGVESKDGDKVGSAVGVPVGL